jgi:hypothetical protein
MKPRYCPECEAGEGVEHEPFGSKERCPFCGGQLASCGCIVTILGLNDGERRAVEEYEDDSVEPLQSIVARWDEVLERRGRVPFVVEPSKDAEA